MENPLKRKRQRADDISQSKGAAKRLKGNFAPVFWDSLSRVPLTPRALRELDRRNDLPRPSVKRTSRNIKFTNLARFARRGGPDLRHLRGCPEPQGNMSSKQSSASGSLPSTKATTVTQTSRKSSAYDNGFQQHLIDHRIYGPDHEYDTLTPEPENLDYIQDALTANRASLSPSQFSSSEFRKFRQKNGGAVFEADVMRDIIPVLCGSATIPNQQNVQFTELEPITHDGVVKPQPDFFDGVRLHALSREARKNDQIQSNVIPTKHPSVPVAPNFYLEVKGPNGSAAVAKRQACYDGAYGVRAMHTLQNLNEATPTYDANAYTYSSTYNAGTGTLQLYAHHMTGSAEGGQPEYHMTQTGAHALTHSREAFVAGATAFRNARDLAQKHRRSFIELANAGVRNADLAAGLAEASAADVADDESNTNIHDRTWLEADDALQRDIVEGYSPSINDDSAEEDAFHCLQAEDDPEDLSQASTALHHDAPSMSFTSSFTSASVSDASSKRPRESHSPPHKSKKGSSSKGAAHKKTLAAESDESRWVETYMHKGKVCFRNSEDQEIKTDIADWKIQMLEEALCFYWVSAKSGRSFWTVELPQGNRRRR